MQLAPWPRKTKLTPSAAAMIRDGLPKAIAAGWYVTEWADDCAAMLGVSRGCVTNVIYGHCWDVTVRD